jgi:V/A-type H+-transporting ATPase subunit E
MSLNKVVEDILRRGEEKKREIIQLGEKERDGQILEADKKIEENRRRSEKKLDSTIAQLEQQELSSAELESKKTLLAAQRKIMEGLRSEALDALASYPTEKRRKLYSKLVTKAKKELGGCYVYSNEADERLLQLPAGMTSGGIVDCAGGLIFESKDRSVRLDYRFESILDEVWNAKMQEIYSRLFR